MIKTTATLDLVEKMITTIGDDPSRPGLKETPARVLRSWQHLFAGYKQAPADVLKAEFPCEHHDYSAMVALGDIEFYSTCEHHMLPFWGRAYVGYIPQQQGKLVGVSKLARLVDLYARRLQVQERITDQVADALQEHLKPLGVAVVLKAQHLCMTARGVQKQNAVMVTSALRGVMERHEVRAEFLALVGLT